MRTAIKLGSILLSGSCLLLGAVPALAGSPAGFLENDSTLTPPQGILSYGHGASRPSDWQPQTELDGDSKPVRESGYTAAACRISGATMMGDAVAFALTPDGQTAVYIADQDVTGRTELYRAPLDGSEAPTNLSSGLGFGAGQFGVSAFQITPDGQNVVFLADPNQGSGVDDLFSVPLDLQSSPTQLSLDSQRPIEVFGLLPDNGTTAFFADVDGKTELYKAVINSSGAPVRLTTAGPSSNVVAATFSPDGSRIIFAAGPAFQWYSVPTSAGAPGSAVQLSAASNGVILGAISPDSSKVLYTADEATAGKFELFSISIDGPVGSAVKLNSPLAGSAVTAFRIGPNSQKVAYLADQDQADLIEAYAAVIGATGSVKLNGTLPTPPDTATCEAPDPPDECSLPRPDVRFVTISPDGQTAVYGADQNTQAVVEILSRPLDGSGAPMTLHGLSTTQDAGSFVGAGTPIFGTRVVYPVFGVDDSDLYSARIDSPGSQTQVNSDGVGEPIVSAFVPVAASAPRLVAYGTSATGGNADRIFVAPIRNDLAVELVNEQATPGDVGVLAFQISADENYLVYLQDETTLGKVELFACPLDSDSDGVNNPDDNCNFIANPAPQSDLLFGQTVRAASKTSFSWPTEADVRFARGPLSSLSNPVADEVGALLEATSYTHTGQPGSSAGFFYLFGLNCGGGSLRTDLGDADQSPRDTLPLP